MYDWRADWQDRFGRTEPKIVCVGLNYTDHAAEQGAKLPANPMLFAKFANALCGDGDDIVISGGIGHVDAEAELAVVIGRETHDVPADDALDVVHGYLCGNDVSARDLQFGDRQWFRGKSQDTFCPVGPGIVPVSELGDKDIWSLLASTPLGRLAVAAGGEIDIFPVNYVVDGQTLLFRTAEGTKLVELTARANVVFEIDGYTEHDAWSVVVKGTAARLDRQLDIDRADTLALSPWIPTFKYVYVRVTPTSLSGRRFRRGPEPDRQAF